MGNTTDAVFTPDYAVAPGETLLETIDAMRMTQAELANRMGRPAKTVNEIINGKAAITPETALQLGRVLGVPAHLWNNLEARYRTHLAGQARRAQLLDEAGTAKRFPYAEMARLGWLPRTRRPSERTENLLSFLGVDSFRQLPAVHAATYRVSRLKTPSDYALVAWTRRGELEAQNVETKPCDLRRLKNSCADIRSMTWDKPEDFIPRLRALCADCGLALVFVPHLQGTYANGAARWLARDKAMIQLSLRGRYSDILWFTLFHEMAHILFHGKRKGFVDTEHADTTQEEQEADRFAADTLIPPPQFERVKQTPRHSEATVRAVAEEIGVPPGIVVGRLHHEGLLPHSHLNALRLRFAWSSEH